MWGAVSAPFTWLTFTISLILALLAAAVWRWAIARRARARTGASWREALWPAGWRTGGLFDPSWLLPAAGVVAASAMIITNRLHWLVRAPHGVSNIVQGWDNQWHANVVRFIMTDHVASATRMGELHNVESHAMMLYPSSFHALVALFAEAAGLESLPAVNIASTVLPAVALPISMVCLVFTVLRSRGLTAQIAGALAAIGVYIAPPLLHIGDYVGMWPYLTAASMVGTVIYLLTQVPARRSLAFASTLAFVGVLGVHPSQVSYIALAVGLYWLTSMLIRPARSRLGDLMWLAIPPVAGVILFLPQVLAGRKDAQEVSSWANPGDLGNPAPWKTIITLTTRHVTEFFPTYSAVTLLSMAGFGALVILLWRGQVWPILFYAISVAVAVNALDPMDGWVGALLAIGGNLHYNTAHRLVMPVAMMTVAGAAIGAAAMVRLLCLAPLAARNGSRSWARASVVASVVLALAAGAGTFWWVQARMNDGAEAAYLSVRSSGRLVNDDDYLAFEWLGSQPAAREGFTAGDPADGFSWIYAYNGVPTIARHFTMSTDGRGSSSDTLNWHTDLLGRGMRGDVNAENMVDRAAKDLDVRFFFSSPQPFWWAQDPNFNQIKGLWTSPGATPVYRKGTTVIFAINAQFTRSELEEMRADALEHGSDSLPELEPVGAAGSSSAE